ncbi:hypothetical protein [uncultured Holdemanella sp.]|uniref:hypothetical protein n=1 Tax=uncultured Holdemanella sp. TaxID=1763549 RepID=UPI00258EC281|nr:hypothetical protein [uncultured Holdemanella sp.]
MKNKKLVIENLDKLKITSIKHNDVIHFKYDRKHYTFNNGGTESTFVMTLYEGRCKCCLKYMASRYGRSNELLQYKYQRTTLNSIDKENFVMLLQEYGFVEYKACKFKVSQFEYDLLNAYKNSGMRKCISNYGTLLEMYGKGHFKGIDTSTPIHEILDDCEVIQ